MASKCRVWTAQAVLELGVTTDLETAGQILGIGRTKAYELARTGEFPVKVLRIGRQFVVPTLPLLRMLEIAGTANSLAESCIINPTAGARGVFGSPDRAARYDVPVPALGIC